MAIGIESIEKVEYNPDDQPKIGADPKSAQKRRNDELALQLSGGGGVNVAMNVGSGSIFSGGNVPGKSSTSTAAGLV